MTSGSSEEMSMTAKSLAGQVVNQRVDGRLGADIHSAGRFIDNQEFAAAGRATWPRPLFAGCLRLANSAGLPSRRP